MAGTIPSDTTLAPAPSLGALLRAFWKIGWLSFGGPVGQIALMHRELVDDRRWVSEPQFLAALNFCHLLPGPEAQQLATYIGWKLHGLRGGLAAGLLFVIPGAAVMLALSLLYWSAARLDWFAMLFLGIKAAVIAIVIQALIRIGRRALTSGFQRVVAVVAFAALYLFALPFPLVVLGAGAAGALAVSVRPGWLKLHAYDPAGLAPRPGLGRTLATVGGCLLLWAAPLLLVLALLGPHHVLWQVGIFFSKLAVVSFGGAYAVLAYMAQQAVQTHQWLSAGEMADGLGLAETTPGPLILVTQFVGFLAGARGTGGLAGGIAAALLTTWVTFSPCFLWIFTFAPWIERLQASKRLAGALAAITAAIVGVIANLSLWFALHVLFARVAEVQSGPVRTLLPELASFDWRAGVLAAVAGVLLIGFKRGVLLTLAVCAAGGLAMRVAGL
ncbi:chromate efflux transporter [Sphingomonas sp.]|uniref:chromate efflux transporter n=1 Tax=Sphingomonas sp. TaxID=28214 RepID=UPI001B1E4101|nr:chromate efflux transporter [Sphingomonas sp.]MBO9714849.1 chromate efflux transporter [Sphingomonas sp.]